MPQILHLFVFLGYQINTYVRTHRRFKKSSWMIVVVVVYSNCFRCRAYLLASWTKTIPREIRKIKFTSVTKSHYESRRTCSWRSLSQQHPRVPNSAHSIGIVAYTLELGLILIMVFWHPVLLLLAVTVPVSAELEGLHSELQGVVDAWASSHTLFPLR